MKFINYSKEVYQILRNKDFSDFIIDDDDFLKVMLSLKKDVSLEEYRRLYRSEIENIIDSDLPLNESDKKFRSNLKNNYYYDETTPKYSALYLFWIWHNNIELTDSELETIIRAIFTGTMGYRFIDMYADDEKQSKEWMFLGNYLIRLFETDFIKTLGLENSYSVIKKYVLEFLRVEYLEKKNLWQSCPFSWENINDLSYKSAPLLAIFESLFNYAEYSEKRRDELINAFIDVLVVNQMMDDLSDAKDDLLKGRETLIMSGFFSNNGTKSITNRTVEKFLSQERLFKGYKTMRSLLENAISIFESYNDEIFLVFTEFFTLKFHRQFEIGKYKIDS